MQDRIWANARWCRANLQTVLPAGGSGQGGLLQAMASEHPELFQCPSTPPMWDMCQPMDVFVFVDAAMHLLFLGTHKALSKEFVPRWLKQHRKLSSYAQELNRKLRLVSDMKLSYLDILPSAGSDEKKATYGGWLSRNLLAHCRVSRWLQSHLPRCRKTDGGGGKWPSHNNYWMYKKCEIKAFCEERMIPMEGAPRGLCALQSWFTRLLASPEKSFHHFDDDDIFEYIQCQTTTKELVESMELSAEERRELFMKYVREKRLIPPQVARESVAAVKEDEVAGDMMDLISLHHCVVARVMGAASAASVGRHVKMFLTLLHVIDKKIDVGGVRVKRELVSKQNYLTLLNLEETINRFGPMRLLWEGGRMGE